MNQKNIRLLKTNKFKRYSSLLSLSFILFFGVTRAQNLVPNGSFEVYDTCPYAWSQINFASGWYSPTLGTPDYYNACSPFPNVPYPLDGYQNAINNGNGYSGIYAISYWPNGVENFREYIETGLQDSLILNHTYNISFYVNLCDGCSYAIRQLGGYLSDNMIVSSDTNYLPYIPQIESNFFLNDTANWIQISGYYLAHGGEKYITIGNFRNASQTDSLFLNGGTHLFAYYYIDSVTIIDCTATGINEQTINSLLQLAPNPASHYFTVKVLQNLVLERVSVYSLIGEQVMEENANSNASELSVNVATLPKGIYLVKVKTNRGVGYKKIVIL